MKAIQEHAIGLCEKQDTLAAIEYLARLDDRLVAMKVFGNLMHHFYWEKKDLTLAVTFGRAGLQYGLTAALDTKISPQQAEQLRSAAKGLAYDVGSFTWPGWDEKGIEIAPANLKVGNDSAKVNLRLAIELKKDALAMSRAHWLVGAHQIAAGQLEPARQSFHQAQDLAKQAGSQAEELLCAGYATVVDELTGQSPEPLSQIKAKLQTVKEGQFFIEQLDTARRVFAEKKQK